MTPKRHIPIRKCVICQSRIPKREMDRFVLQIDQIVHDAQHNAPGRGFYICHQPACQEKREKVIKHYLALSRHTSSREKRRDG